MFAKQSLKSGVRLSFVTGDHYLVLFCLNTKGVLFANFVYLKSKVKFIKSHTRYEFKTLKLKIATTPPQNCTLLRWGFTAPKDKTVCTYFQYIRVLFCYPILCLMDVCLMLHMTLSRDTKIRFRNKITIFMYTSVLMLRDHIVHRLQIERKNGEI